MKNFTPKLLFLVAFLLTATLSMAQTVYTTVGIIGSATANGWNASTAMTLVSPTNVHVWTITLPLTKDEVKFRANNDWTVNWGALTFPAGTGVQNGANIPIGNAGTYTVQFNDLTGAYQFSTVTAVQAASALASPKLLLAPNPARESMSVAYDLAAASTVSIAVQNSLGQTVRQLTGLRQGAGRQEQQLPLQGLSAGVYLVRVQTDGQWQTARLLVE